MSLTRTNAADEVLLAAATLARENRHVEVTTAHLLLAATGSGVLMDALALAGDTLTREEIRRRFSARTATVSQSGEPASRYSVGALAALESAEREARAAGAAGVGPEYLLLGLMTAETSRAILIVHDLHCSPASVRAAILQVMTLASTAHLERNIFVVHGRDPEARQAFFDFLRDLRLFPLEWDHVVAFTGMTMPFIGDAIYHALDNVKATVVLMTPDDIGECHPDFYATGDDPTERTRTGQARQNVIFEAGMAMVKMPERTLFVEIGKLRPFNDMAGRNVVRLTPDPTDCVAKLRRIATRLRDAGCKVDDSGTDWLRTDRFVNLDAHHRGPRS